VGRLGSGVQVNASLKIPLTFGHLRRLRQNPASGSLKIRRTG